MAKYIATLRATFDADDDVGAELVANELAECGAEVLEDDDTIDVTQVLGVVNAQTALTALEICEQVRRTRDIFIRTRIKQLFELAKELDKTAWILEHRNEAAFDLAGYDYTAFMERAEELLNESR